MRVLLVLLTLLLATGQGHAQASARDLPARLSVEAGAGAELCPNQGEIARRVEAILHRPLRQEVTASELAIDVRFERATDGTLLARVAARGSKSGQRLLRDTGPTCSALGEAVSVAIALLLDNALNEAADAGSSSQPAPAPSAPAPTNTADSVSVDSRASVPVPHRIHRRRRATARHPLSQAESHRRPRERRLLRNPQPGLQRLRAQR